MMIWQKALVAICASVYISVLTLNLMALHMEFNREQCTAQTEGIVDEQICTMRLVRDAPVKDPDVIRILSWTRDFATLTPVGTETFADCGLPANKTCESVLDRCKADTCDVIYFHGQVLDPSEMPESRSPHQKWLFYESEAPPQTWQPQLDYDSIQQSFNLTSTYTLDSDIPLLEFHRECHVSQKKLEALQKSGTNYAEGKGERVAWFVSHCNTHSLREKYVDQLSKYIPVDVWGRCGNYSCGHRYKRTVCDRTVISTRYKFYLSLENSVCEDYVTEKLWRFIGREINAIPIVLGGIDYAAVLPKGTYLNVKDFRSPKHLAEYLRKLHEDDALFNKYIRRKNSVICKFIGDRSVRKLDYNCRLCKYLHEHKDDVTQVPDVVDFWSEKRRCTTPKDYYSGCADELALSQS